ncbi:MAG: hypothetical protein QOD72_3738 [Acidimicrobiaceae bacterium]|nr:hypothetical protein [Acidimicrobiaceae bacterium]
MSTGGRGSLEPAGAFIVSAGAGTGSATDSPATTRTGSPVRRRRRFPRSHAVGDWADLLWTPGVGVVVSRRCVGMVDAIASLLDTCLPDGALVMVHAGGREAVARGARRARWGCARGEMLE